MAKTEQGLGPSRTVSTVLADAREIYSPKGRLMDHPETIHDVVAATLCTWAWLNT